MPESLLIPTASTADVMSYQILVDGNAVPLSVAVLSMKVTMEINKISSLKLNISDGTVSSGSFVISEGDQFIVGSEIEVQLGYHGSNTTVFKGIIISQAININPSSGSYLVVEAKDKAVIMTIGQRSAHFNDKTDSDILENFVAKYSLDNDIESTSIIHKNIVQYNTTDWDFMMMRMDLAGMICKIENGKMIFKKPDLTATSALDVSFGSSILSLDAKVDAREQNEIIKGRSWDYNLLDMQEVYAQDPVIGAEAGNFSITQLSEANMSVDYQLMHAGKLDQEELQAWADSKAQKQRLSKVSGNVTIIGYGDIKLDSYITLHNVGARFNGPVYVNAIKHNVENNTWTTDIQFGMNPQWYAETIASNNSTNAQGYVSGINGLVIGIVTDLEDPLNEARIRIKIPVFSLSDEGVWARIASLDAGNERGMFFRPEVGDEVIVGCIQGDASQLVILGMLHGQTNVPPISANNDNHVKGYTSREKMILLFNDEEKSIKIETPGGKKVLISDQEGKIHLEDEFNNKITMESGGITIDAAMDLNLKAGMNVNISGAMINSEASGINKVNGSMVTIN
jgi:Rhs element Vgr protein